MGGLLFEGTFRGIEFAVGIGRTLLSIGLLFTTLWVAFRGGLLAPLGGEGGCLRFVWVRVVCLFAVLSLCGFGKMYVIV